ncbi:MAG: hypothetical protein K0S51_1221 [Bacillales bacterium]|jgi:hypothetical protein|nr:hypothetical protein [Bacillales bacterium]
MKIKSIINIVIVIILLGIDNATRIIYKENNFLWSLLIIVTLSVLSDHFIKTDKKINYMIGITIIISSILIISYIVGEIIGRVVGY